MPSFEAWQEHRAARALEAVVRIGAQAVEISIRRSSASEGSQMLNPQRVRVEFGNSAREDLDVRRGLNVLPGVQRAVVFGVRDHPTAADTDIQLGDRFVIEATEFEVIAVIVLAGEVQAFCEART